MQRPAAIVLTLATMLLATDVHAWEQVLNKNGVRIYKRKAANSRIHELKGTAVIPAPMLEVLTVILDYRRFKQWQPNLITFQRLKVVSDIEFVNYAAMSMPWPVQSRDMVMRARFEIDRKRRWFHVTWRETSWRTKPVRKDFVRVPKSRVRWSLRSLDGGRKTWVEFRALGDPGGWIPVWLVNYFSRYMLADSFRRLTHQVRQRRFDPRIMSRYSYIRSWYVAGP